MNQVSIVSATVTAMQIPLAKGRKEKSSAVKIWSVKCRNKVGKSASQTWLISSCIERKWLPNGCYQRYPLNSVSFNYDSRKDSGKEKAAETVTHEHMHPRQDKHQLQSYATQIISVYSGRCPRHTMKPRWLEEYFPLTNRQSEIVRHRYPCCLHVIVG